MSSKEAMWHARNEAGSLYARLIRSGPMLDMVARRESPGDPAEDGSRLSGLAGSRA